MSALGQKRTLPILFDHLIGAPKQGNRHCDAECLCCLEVDNELYFRCLLDWQVGRFLALEDAVNVGGRGPREAYDVSAVGSEAADGDVIAEGVDSRQSVPCCERRDHIGGLDEMKSATTRQILQIRALSSGLRQLRDSLSAPEAAPEEIAGAPLGELPPDVS